MRIESIRWLSRSADEAEIVVSDGCSRCEVYAQPCTASVGEEIDQPLHVFGVRNAMLTGALHAAIQKVDAGGLAQRIVAKVENWKEGHLSVGNIQLIADDPLPGGVQNGDFVELECARIDYWGKSS